MASSPKSPDPYKQASADQKAQSTAAQQSAIINNPNESNYYGSQNYSIAGWEKTQGADGKWQYTPRYNKTTTLSPAEQRIAEQDSATRYNLGATAANQSGKLDAYLSERIDPSKWQAWQMAAAPGEVRQDQGPTDRAAIERAMGESYHRQADPQFKAQDTQLALRGLNPGSQGYGSFQQGREDAMGEAARQGYLASGAESRNAQGAYNDAARMRYELGADWANQANTLRQAQAQEAGWLRNQPINEIMALMGGSQVNMPQFSSFSRQGIGAASPGQYVSQNYQTKSAEASAFNKGLFGLAGAGLGAWAGRSDRRLKEDIVPLGHELAGAPLYAFRYIDRPGLQTGVMADEVRELHPDAVHVGADGFDAVDYAMLLRRA
ncbi:MAG TPA: tail fiber domain-containing protein [Candidatus Polarisedimenticolia bacterium]|jgi:hypothetical protein|nr:tail fiber domain-containing protein [Candidatus Polarisedimenticolia bacterium]